jgi:hypothetical protein
VSARQEPDARLRKQVSRSAMYQGLIPNRP